MLTLQKFHAFTDTDAEFPVWAIDHDDAWTLSDEHASKHGLGRVTELRATLIRSEGTADA